MLRVSRMSYKYNMANAPGEMEAGCFRLQVQRTVITVPGGDVTR